MADDPRFNLARLNIGVAMQFENRQRDQKRLEQQATNTGKRVGEKLSDGVEKGFEKFDNFLGRFSPRLAQLSRGLREGVGAAVGFVQGKLDGSQNALRNYGRGLDALIAKQTLLGRSGKVAAAGLASVKAAVVSTAAAITPLTIGLGAVAAALGVGAVAAAARFETNWNRVLTLLGPDSERVFEGLESQVDSLITSFGQNATDGLNAFYNVLSAMPELTKEPERALSILGASAKVASTGFASMTEAGQAITTVLTNFKKPAEEAEEVASKLFATQDQGITTFGQLANSMSNVASLANTLNVSLEEVLAPVAVLTSKGTETGEAMNQMRSAMLGIVRLTPEASRTIAQLNEETAGLNLEVSAAAVQSKGFLTVIRDIIEATDGDVDLIAKIFGRQEAIQFVATLSRNLDQLDRVIQELEDSEGSLAEKVEIANDSLIAQGRILFGTLATQFRDLGRPLEEAGTGVLKFVNDSIDQVGRLKQGVRDFIEDADQRIIDFVTRAESREIALELEIQAEIARLRLAGLDEVADHVAQRFADRTLESVENNISEGIGEAVSGGIDARIENLRAEITAFEEQAQRTARETFQLTGSMKAFDQANQEVEEFIRTRIQRELQDMAQNANFTESAFRKMVAVLMEYGVSAKDAGDETDDLARKLERAESAVAGFSQAFSEASRLEIDSRFVSEGTEKALDELAKMRAELMELDEQAELLRNAGRPLAEGFEEARARLVDSIDKAEREIVRKSEIISERMLELLALDPSEVRERIVSGIGEALRGVERELGTVGGLAIPLPPLIVPPETTEGLKRQAQQALKDAEETLEPIEAQLKLAQLTGDEALENQARKALRKAQAAILKEVGVLAKKIADALGLDDEQFQAFFDGLIEGLQELGIEIESIGDDGTKTFEDWASEIEGVVRGLTAVLDTLNLIDDETRQVLDGITNLAAGVGRIAAGDVIGGGIQAVGGLVQTIGGLFGGDDETKKFHQQNLKTLAEIRDALSDVGKLQALGFSGAEIESLISAANDFREQLEALPPSVREVIDEHDLLRKILKEYGFSNAELKAIAEELGIAYDESISTFFDLVDALNELKDTTQDLGQTLRNIDREAEFFNLSQSEILQRQVEALREFTTGATAKGLERALKAGLDTEEGLAILNATIEKLFRDLVDARNLGDLTAAADIEDTLDLLQDIRDSIEEQQDELGVDSDGELGAVQVRRAITETTANVMISILSTMVYFLEQIRDLLAGREVDLEAPRAFPLGEGVGVVEETAKSVVAAQQDTLVEDIAEGIRQVFEDIFQIPSTIAPEIPILNGSDRGNFSIEINASTSFGSIIGQVVAGPTGQIDENQVRAAATEAGTVAGDALDRRLRTKLGQHLRSLGQPTEL